MRNEADWLTSYLKLTENSEPTYLFRLWSGISAIAAALRRKCYLPWGLQGDIFPNMYIVLVGPTGAGKTAAIRPAFNMVGEIPSIILAPESATSAALIEMFSTLAVCDIVDAVEQTTKRHSSITAVAGELAVFLEFGEVNKLSFVTDAWDCKAQPWQRGTRGHGIESIPGIWLNIIGGTTPSLLKTMLPQDSGVEGGLSSRMIFVYAEGLARKVPIPLLNEEDKNLRQRLLQDLENISNMVGNYKLTTDFVDQWIPWFYECAHETVVEGPMFAGYSSRRHIHALKLCLILSASENDSMEISARHLTKALDILTETEKLMPNCFSSFGRVDYMEVIPRVTSIIGLYKRISFNQLLSKVMRDVKVAELQDIVDVLARTGTCTIDRVDGTMWIHYKGKKESSDELPPNIL